jgi:hypothetical protein
VDRARRGDAGDVRALSRAAAARPRRAVGLALFTRDGCAATSPRTDLAHDIDHAFGELATPAEGVVGA